MERYALQRLTLWQQVMSSLAAKIKVPLLHSPVVLSSVITCPACEALGLKFDWPQHLIINGSSILVMALAMLAEFSLSRRYRLKDAPKFIPRRIWLFLLCAGPITSDGFIIPVGAILSLAIFVNIQSRQPSDRR
jgi:hypothetical protein